MISGRKVRPLTNRVNSTKPVVSTATKWRTCGGSAAFSVTASASASETAPRSPPHQITTLKEVLKCEAMRNRLKVGNSP